MNFKKSFYVSNLISLAMYYSIFSIKLVKEEKYFNKQLLTTS